MEISNALIKHYLRNVLFINGNSYAGKSTMAKMLADNYGLIHCGENYDCVPEGIIDPEKYPNLGYFQTMNDWQEFINRTPEQYDNWIKNTSRELVEFEITYLISISGSQRVIVDTNIPVEVLREIADYDQVAIMLTHPSISVENFFDRNDDKSLFLEHINKSNDPKKSMENFLACMHKINHRQYYDEFNNTGFFTLERKDTQTDTRHETLEILAQHFGFKT